MPASLISPFVVLLSSFALCLGLTAWVRRWLLKHAVMDIPNERSSHKIPVPRGGGWALVLVLLPGLLVTGIGYQDLQTYGSLLVGLLLLVAISWLDDQRHIHPLIRLALHVLAAFIATGSLPAHSMVLNGYLPFWLDRVLMILGWAWFMNLYNFMDGIDGITGAETIALATGGCLLMTFDNLSLPYIETMTLLLSGVSLGFLAFNWHPAKIFLGDVGSVPLGYLLGFMLIVLATNGVMFPAFILPLYYIADSGLTLTKRALRGEKIWQAHRQHFYQRAAAGLGRHDQVVVIISVANALLLGAALLAIRNPLTGFTLAVGIVGLLLALLQKLSRRTAN